MGAGVGLIATLLAAMTGDSSAYQVAQVQPMKLAAMEALYNGGKGEGLTAIAAVHPFRQPDYENEQEPAMRIAIPNMLSFLATRTADGYVPGVNNILNGYTKEDGTREPSVQEKIARGKKAIVALKTYRETKAKDQLPILKENMKYFGYGYMADFGDIFLPDYKNNKESVFAVQTSDYSEDHTTFGRANWSNMLNGCWGIWSCGWDFHKPSQNLVNAFKTKNGLPEFDDYNKTCDYPVNGEPNSQKWDPRLFHTVGMPTFPYKYESEYTMTKANSRTPNVYGYYTSLKEVPQRSKGETFNGSWQAFAMNDYVLRYSDIMLMRAEALIELDRLAEARTIINDIRQRAKNSVDKHIEYAKDQCDIALYPESYFQDKETARKCLRWERRLEMAMENGRFFDLRRWGIASETLNKYFESEQKDQYGEQTYAQYLKDAKFTPGKNEFYPVPYNQLYYIPGLYKQNKGYE